MKQTPSFSLSSTLVSMSSFLAFSSTLLDPIENDMMKQLTFDWFDVDADAD
jgi:hypothetical protein